MSLCQTGVHDDSGYNTDDDMSVGDGESGYYGRAVHGGGVQYQVVLLLDHVERDPVNSEAEHVADIMGGGDIQLAAVEAELDAGGSTMDAVKVLSCRRHNGDDGIRNLMQQRVRTRLN